MLPDPVWFPRLAPESDSPEFLKFPPIFRQHKRTE
jgi:hypothetical protein